MIKRKTFKSEAEFQGEFTAWLKRGRGQEWLRRKGFTSAGWELKLSSQGSIPFSEIKEHQVEALLRVKNDNFCYKISDSGVGYKPFDCFTLHGGGFLVLGFNGGQDVVIVDAEEYWRFREGKDRGSITLEVAEELGELVNLI